MQEQERLKSGRGRGMRAGLAVMAACWALTALGAGGALDRARAQTADAPPPLGSPTAAARSDCLDPLANLNAAPPISVELFSTAPAEICAPHFQVIEFRNLSDKALGGARLLVETPSDPRLMQFLPLRPGSDTRVEVSSDDGATWRPVGAPSGRGVEGDPLVWTETEALPLARLGPYASPDDSLLFRWRAALGDGFGDPFGPSPRLVLQGEAIDACGRRVASPLRSARIPVLRPELRARLTGRNADRGGAFSERVRAAPGDRIEWRVAIENVGDAPTEAGRLALTGETGRPLGDIAFDPIGAGGRRVVAIEQTAGPSCRVQPVFAEAAWGCAPPLGRPDAIGAGPIGAGRAAVDTALSASDLTLEQKVVDRLGADRPGALADVSLILENRGAPAFDPVIDLSLPDGFALDPDRPPELFVIAGPALRVAIVEETAGRTRLALQASADGAAQRPALDPDSKLELRFGIRRTRPSLLDRDDLETVLNVVDGCDAPVQARPARTAVESRRPDLAVTLAPVSSALVSGAGEHVRFAAHLTNLGEDIARAPHLVLRLGEGWRGGEIEGCRPEAENAGGAARRIYRCEVGRDLGPSAEAELLIDLETALEPGEAPLGPESYAIEAEARHEGPAAPAGLERAVARAHAVGLSLRQALFTEAGAPREADRPIDLGERVVIELDARWFAGGGAGIEGVTLTQALPSSLRLVRHETVDVGAWQEIENDGVLTSGGRVHWSLRPFAGEARFRARLLVEAVDPGGARAALRNASVEALASFRRGDENFGVDQARDPAATAPSLPLVFRRPDVRLVLSRDGPDAAPSADRGPARLEAQRGAPETFWVGLHNVGAGPGFVDWLALETPASVEITPSERDGLDNDRDGAVDEADEALFSVVEEPRPGVSRRRWVLLPGAAATAAPGRLEPGERRVWPLALNLAASLSPGDEQTVTLESSIGARPLAERSDARQRARRTLTLAAPTLSGFLVFSNIAPAEPLEAGESPSARRLRRGDSVELRASLVLPAGPLESLRLRVNAPPALAGLTAVAAQRGSGLVCDNGAAPETTADGGALWRLGDCRAPGASPEAARLAIFDVMARVEDAPGGADAATLEAWRDGRVSVDALWREPFTGVEKQVRIAEARMRLGGPSLAWTLETTPADALGAGDAFAVTARIENRGDAPASDVALTFDAGRRDPEIDCTALTLAVDGGAAGSGCDAELTLTGALAPGESRVVSLSGRIGGAIRMGRSARIGLVAGGAETGPRAAAITAAIPLAGLPRPTLAVERIGAAPLEAVGPTDRVMALPGDRFSVQLDMETPVGAVGAVAEIAVRLLSGDATPASQEEALQALSVVDGPALEPARDARRLGGWLTVSIPLTADAGAATTDAAPGGGARTVVLALNDAPPVRAGRRLEIVGSVRAGARARASDRVQAIVAEPFLDLAARALNRPEPHIEARLCNRGSAPAYGAQLRLAPPAQARFRRIRLSPAEAPAVESTGIEPLSIGATRQDASGATVIDSGATPLAPGACFVLDAVVERGAPGGGARPAFGAGGPADQATLTLLGFRAEPSDQGVSRRYRTEQSVTVGLPAASLALIGPARVIASGAGGAGGAGGDRAATARSGVFSAPFAVSLPAGAGEARLSISARSDPELVWTLWRDLDGDGLRDASEPRWNDGATVPAAQGAIAFVAEAELPATADGRAWRGHLHLRAVGVTADGAAASGARTLALLGAVSPSESVDAGSDGEAPRPGGARDALAGLSARRLMAVDRDCDGDRGDELGQDALFEASKLAAPGECVIMRLEFENQGARAVERVVIEDRPPSASRYVARSARFATTPSGLISGAIHEPVAHGATAPEAQDAAEGLVRFDYFGVLGPGQSGAVEYSVRLSDGS